LTYGNNLTLSMSYNSRLQSTQFEVAGRPSQYGSSTVMKSQYQYYDDGALKYADDLLDSRFDRAYGYDQTTRLKEDYSGSEASDFINQTSSGTTTGPYRQSFSYDAWSNFTSRTGRFWSKSTTFTASYSNGRNTNSLWQYDADGRVLRENSLQYTFDAAGRNVTTSSILVNQFVGGIVTQTRDGDGLGIKREETRQGATTIGYRLRSTVLGGRVVTELNASGQKQKTYVYLGGERLAEQEGGSVTWKHSNPVTGSEGSSYASGLYSPEKELDPMLVDVGFVDPYLYWEEPQPDRLQLLGGNSNGQCIVEGMSWDCMSAYRLMELNVADEVVPTTVYAVYKSGRVKPIWTGLASHDPLGHAVSSSPVGDPSSRASSTGSTGSNGHADDSGSEVLAGTSDSSVTVIAGADYVSTGPQDPSRLTETQVEKLRGNLQKFLNDPECGKFINALLNSLPNEVASTTKRVGSLMGVFNNVDHGGGFWSGDTNRKNALAITNPNTMTTTFDSQRSTPLITGKSWEQFGATVLLAHELTHIFTHSPNAGVYAHVQMAQAASAAASSLGLDVKGALMLDFPDPKNYTKDDDYDLALSEYYNRTLAYACRKVKL